MSPDRCDNLPTHATAPLRQTAQDVHVWFLKQWDGKDDNDIVLLAVQVSSVASRTQQVQTLQIVGDTRT
jgi:hypothetical protein